MCVVSMVMDHYREKWTPLVPSPMVPGWQPVPMPLRRDRDVRRDERPAIAPEEIAEFRRLLERAREYDKRNHEPDCELDEKRAALLVLAKQLGVDISFVEKANG